MHTDPNPAGAGLLGSLKNLFAHGLALLQTRVELLAVEIDAERSRLLRMMAFGLLTFFLLGFGALALALWLTILLWDTQRLLPLALLSGLLLGGGLVSLALFLRPLFAGSRLFAATLAEFTQDREALERRP